MNTTTISAEARDTIIKMHAAIDAAGRTWTTNGYGGLATGHAVIYREDVTITVLRFAGLRQRGGIVWEARFTDSTPVTVIAAAITAAAE